MTWKDKLEIGLKEDAPYRKDNLPDQQVRGPEIPAGEGRSPIVPAAAGDVNKIGQAHGRPKRIRKKFVPPLRAETAPVRVRRVKTRLYVRPTRPTRR